MFSYTILCVDSAFGPSEQGAFPKALSKVNRHNAPIWSVIVSALFIQAFIMVIYINAGTYQAVYAMSTSAIMIPYVFSAFYYLKLMIRGQGLENGNNKYDRSKEAASHRSGSLLISEEGVK